MKKKNYPRIAKFILFVILGVSFFVGFPNFTIVKAQSGNNIKDFAKCVTNRGFTMYGTNGCSACDIERGYFGENFQYIRYVNCDQYPEVCQVKKLRGYPTWEDGRGRQYRGAMKLEILAQISGCQLVDRVEKGTSSSINLTQFIGAFVAGLLSFIAPCLLPLLPSYFSIITGFTFADLYGLNFGKIRRRVFTSSLFFSLGFTIVFTVLGATGSIVGQLLDTYLPFLLKLNGIFLIFLGLLQIGIIKFEALQFDYAWRVQKRLANLGFITALVTGIVAALSWIPCIGPLLTPILILSARSDTVLIGTFLLFVYSLGLTLPFLLIGLFFPKAVGRLQQSRLLFHRLSQIAGIFLIIFGIILLLEKYRLFLELFYNSIGAIYKK